MWAEPDGLVLLLAEGLTPERRKSAARMALAALRASSGRERAGREYPPMSPTRGGAA
jgi:hypothetical protein